MLRTLLHDGCEYTVCEYGVVADRFIDSYARMWKQPLAMAAPREEHVAACMEWLGANAKPRPTVNTRIGSYGLKHVVEKTAPDGYVTNGALIEAVCRLGWDVIPDGPESPNACFRLNYDKGALRW